MVYTNIMNIRGVVIDNFDDLFHACKTLGSYVAVDIIRQIKEAGEEADTIDLLIELCNSFESDNEIDLYTWTCCSDLQYKKWVIGIEIYTPRVDFTVNNIHNEIVNVDMKDLLKIEREVLCLEQFGKLQNVLMIDDCFVCT